MVKRDRLQAAIKARLDRFAERDDAAAVLDGEAGREAAELAELIDNDDAGMYSRYLLGWFHWYRYGAKQQDPPDATAMQDLRAAIELLTPGYIAGWELAELPGPLLPRLAEEITSAIDRLFGQAWQSTDLRLVTVTVDVMRRFLLTAGPDNPNRAAVFCNLSNVLHHRFSLTGELADLDDGVQTARESVRLAPEGSLDRGRFAANLGGTLLARFRRTGAPADLDEAIATLETAIGAFPADAPDRVQVLASLADARQAQFGRTGAPADLAEAIRIGDAALAAVADDQPLLRASILSSLGYSMLDRFDRSGMLADLDQAVLAAREAVALAPLDSPDGLVVRVGLGVILRRRAERTGTLADLDEAVRISRELLVATPVGHGSRAAVLTLLANTLKSRFHQTGSLADLEQAVQASREALTAGPADGPDWGRHASNLAAKLRDLFERTRNPADLDEAVRSGRAAVSAAPADNPSRAGYLSNLGNILRLRYEWAGDPADRDQAIDVYREASEAVAGPPSVRAWAARGAGTLAAGSRPALAASLLERAVRLLPEVAPREQRRGDQQHALGDLSGVAADAAALALADPGAPADSRAGTALRLLEAGRAVLLSQALEVRSDLTDLTREHPELAVRFTQLRARLDTDPPRGSDDGRGDHSDEARRQLAVELRAALEQIRGQHGFASFGLPPSEAELLQQATEGPVVVLNVSEHRSDALLLTAGGITSLALPDLREADLYEHIRSFHRALANVSHGHTSADRRSAQAQLNQTLEWLWDTTAGPVLDALGLTAQPGPDDPWPRLWWAPGGLLGLLPVHAAGYHADGADAPGGRAVIDRVVSSYTATVAALRYARRPAPSGLSPALIVAMPTTPGLGDQGRLSFVGEEAEALADQLPGSITMIEPDPDDDLGGGPVPTLANVLARLADCPVAHFACHGVSDVADPSRSRLLLHDHDVAPLTVAALSALSLEHAQLAYLSACQTALSPGDRLIDEAIHLTSAFQLAGYRHVIGTLWAIGDDAGTVAIAETCYAGITELGVGQAAHALHRAVRAIREAAADADPRTPTRWAAHIHTGALS